MNTPVQTSVTTAGKATPTAFHNLVSGMRTGVGDAMNAIGRGVRFAGSVGNAFLKAETGRDDFTQKVARQAKTGKY